MLHMCNMCRKQRDIIVYVLSFNWVLRGKTLLTASQVGAPSALYIRYFLIAIIARWSKQRFSLFVSRWCRSMPGQSAAQPFRQESWFLSCRLRLTEAKVFLVYVSLVSVPHSIIRSVLFNFVVSGLWFYLLMITFDITRVTVAIDLLVYQICEWHVNASILNSAYWYIIISCVVLYGNALWKWHIICNATTVDEI